MEFRSKGLPKRSVDFDGLWSLSWIVHIYSWLWAFQNAFISFPLKTSILLKWLTWLKQIRKHQRSEKTYRSQTKIPKHSWNKTAVVPGQLESLRQQLSTTQQQLMDAEAAVRNGPSALEDRKMKHGQVVSRDFEDFFFWVWRWLRNA